MPEEIVSVSPSKGATGKCISDSSSLDKSDLAEQLASKPDELQEQAGAEQVGFYAALQVSLLSVPQEAIFNMQTCAI